jgi:hypothetical protein
MENVTRWTARGALMVSLGALAISAWSAGCGSNERAEPRREPAPEARVAEPTAPPPAGSVEPSSPRPAAPDPVRAAPRPAGELSVRRLAVTHAIEQREPVAAPTIQAGEPLIAFLDLKNPGEATHVVVTFERDGAEPVGHVELRVPANASRWRTWARTGQVKQPGAWEVVVRDPGGKELARSRFEAEAGGGPKDALIVPVTHARRNP